MDDKQKLQLQKMISENKNNLFIEMLSKEKLFKFDEWRKCS